MSIFDKRVDRRGSNSQKWDRYKGEDIIPLWVADMDFEAPSPIVEAIKKRIEHKVFGYSPIEEETLEAFIDFVKRHYEWEIKKEWIIFSYGVVISMNFVTRFINSKEVITTTPIYPHFIKAPKNAGSEVIKVPLREKNRRWSIDFNEFEKSISKDCRLFLFCNPHNPGGTAFTKEELKKLANIAKRHNLIVCSDEIHSDLILNPKSRHIPIASINKDMEQRTITLLSPSKSFNIAGLKSSFIVIANDSLREEFKRYISGLVDDPNIFANIATKIAYRECDEWLFELRDYLRENLKLVQEFVAKNPKLKLLNQDATFLAWIDVSGLNLKSPYEYFLEYGVGLSDGKDFGDERFLRLNFGTQIELLVEALNRMQRAIDNLD
ncbi:MAG: putative C-S lyase [Epsilonproteobacteria bacterium]|nr:putative C-S lyase [Campylobacterota bacterium]